MRKLMWFSIGFLAACAFGTYCYINGLMIIAAVCMVAAVILAVAARRLGFARIAAVVCVGLSLGLCWFWVYDAVFLKQARHMDGKTEEVTFIVRDYSYETPYGSAVDATLMMDGHPYKTRVYLDQVQRLKPGDRIIGDFSFRYTTTGGSQEVLYHRSEGIFLLAYQEGQCVYERFWSTPLADYPALWRDKLTRTIEAAFPKDTAGFAKALLMGDRSDISYETSTDFKVSGISHIIAVSGLHVSILFGLIYFLTGKRRVLTALLGIPIVLMFAAVAGFTPSITRAAIMQILIMLALLVGKEYDPPTSLSFAALVMLLVNPLVVSSISFQLSFACMAGIVFLSEPIRAWLLDESRFGRYTSRIIKSLCVSVSVSVSATVFTMPLVALHFGTVSLVSIVTNLLTLWVVTYIFYGIMLVCLIGIFSAGAASILAWIVSWLIRYVLGAADVMASFPLAAVYTKSVYIVAWLVFCYVLLVIFIVLKKKPMVLFGCLVTIGLCLSVALSWLEPMLWECRMMMLDVGQGQCILLQSGGRTFLVDCGGDYGEDSADLAAETLLSQGISRLDGVILTHYDADHSGGLEYLLTRIDTELVFVPDIEDEHGVADRLREQVGEAVVVVSKNMTASCDSAQLQLYAPFSYESGNEGSFCVLFQTENCDILITGDRGAVGERLLLRGKELPQVDVLVVGHHGSKHSTSQELLDAVQPTYAFISVGEGNRYGHPADVILQRLLEFGCIIFRTDENGTIIFRR